MVSLGHVIWNSQHRIRLGEAIRHKIYGIQCLYFRKLILRPLMSRGSIRPLSGLKSPPFQNLSDRILFIGQQIRAGLINNFPGIIADRQISLRTYRRYVFGLRTYRRYVFGPRTYRRYVVGLRTYRRYVVGLRTYRRYVVGLRTYRRYVVGLRTRF